MIAEDHIFDGQTKRYSKIDHLCLQNHVQEHKWKLVSERHPINMVYFALCTQRTLIRTYLICGLTDFRKP